MERYVIYFWGFFLIFSSLVVHAEGNSDEDFAIRNVEVYYDANDIVVTYDLAGPIGETIGIGMSIIRKRDNTMFTPRSVRGAIGDEIHPGSGKEIRWSYLNDVGPNDLGEGEDIDLNIWHFENGGVSWLMYAAGGLAAGAIAGVLIFGSGGDESGPPTSPDLLAEPPRIRPHP